MDMIHPYFLFYLHEIGIENHIILEMSPPFAIILRLFKGKKILFINQLELKLDSNTYPMIPKTFNFVSFFPSESLFLSFAITIL